MQKTIRVSLLVALALLIVAPPRAALASGCEPIQGYHTVRAGETIYAIGRAYATRPGAIAACNGIVNPNRIAAGVALAIPTAPWDPVPAGPTADRQFPSSPPPTPPPAPTCRYHHTVQYGESLSLLGWRYGVSIWAIAEANGITNLNLIYVGDVLCIP